MLYYIPNKDELIKQVQEVTKNMGENDDDNNNNNKRASDK